MAKRQPTVELPEQALTLGELRELVIEQNKSAFEATARVVGEALRSDAQAARRRVDLNAALTTAFAEHDQDRDGGLAREFSVGETELEIRRTLRRGKFALQAVCVDADAAARAGVKKGAMATVPVKHLKGAIIDFENSQLGYSDGERVVWAWGQVTIKRGDARRIAASYPVKKSRGRRRGSTKTNWPLFEIEVHARLDQNGELGSKPGWYEGVLLEKMLEWCSVSWPSEPGQTMAREHIQAVVEQRQRTANRINRN